MNGLQVLSALPSCLTWRQKLAYLVYRFHDLEQVECPVEHTWKDGKYVREMRIPADTLFIGRAHFHGHFCELLEGRAIHVLPNHRVEREPPYSTTTIPGYQMVFYAVTPVVGRTVHPDTGERDIERAEAEIFEPLSNLLMEGEKIYTRISHEMYRRVMRGAARIAP